MRPSLIACSLGVSLLTFAACGDATTAPEPPDLPDAARDRDASAPDEDASSARVAEARTDAGADPDAAPARRPLAVDRSSPKRHDFTFTA